MFNLLLTAIVAVTCIFIVTSCQDTDIDGFAAGDTNVMSVPDRTNGSETIYSNSKTIFGKTDKYWIAEWWKYFMSLDCTHNPLNMASFTASMNQQSPVVFLAGMPTGISVRYVEVTRNKALLIPLMNVMKEYSATYIDQNPRPGQTVEQFLKSEAQKYINQATNLSALLDGHKIEITNNNWIASDLFFFKGNTQLNNCVSHLISGQSQAAVTDGYWLYFRTYLRAGIPFMFMLRF